jgi:hypothetical protein
VISFEQGAHWIVAGAERAGWTGELSGAQLRQFSAAVLGLYKLAGVDFVAEQLQSLFGPAARFDFHRNDLIVWPAGDFSVRGLYDLTQDGDLSPRGASLPVLRREDVFFREVRLPREAWVRIWEADASEAELPEVRVLPGRAVVGAEDPVAALAASRV